MTKIAPQIASPAAISCGNSAGPTWSPGIDGNPHAFQRIAAAKTIKPAPTRESLNFMGRCEARGSTQRADNSTSRLKDFLDYVGQDHLVLSPRASHLVPDLLRHSEFLHEHAVLGVGLRHQCREFLRRKITHPETAPGHEFPVLLAIVGLLDCSDQPLLD